MGKESKRRIRITIFGIVGLLLLVVGVSFAAFTADILGTQTQSISVGCLKVDMEDEGALNIEGAAPETDENGLTQEPYTYTITNNCTADAYYEATLNIMDTSDMSNVSKMKVALTGDSYLEPTIIEDLPSGELLDEDITGVSYTYKIDDGYLAVGKSKTFELRTWYDYDVEEISGKLESKVIINSTATGSGIVYNRNTSGYYAVSKNTKLTGVNYKNISPSTNETSGVVEIKNGVEDTTYHFRGTPNNYVTFGNANSASTYSYTNSAGTKVNKSYALGDSFKWKILSTNNDGSINLILDDIIGEVTFANASSTLTTFYNTHLKDEEAYIDTTKEFCIEKANSDGTYLAALRVTNNNPTNKCTSTDKFTTIGLATVDDLMYAGGVYNTANESFYLYKDSKGFMTSSHSASNKIYNSTGSISIGDLSTSTENGIRPVITLKSSTMLQGEGTEDEQFYVSGSYDNIKINTEDTTAPTISLAEADDKWTNTNKPITINAKDNTGGSGIAGYLVKTSSTTPSTTDTGWMASTSIKYTTVNTYASGTYYVFAKDNAGNISESKKVVVDNIDTTAPTCTIKINPSGSQTTYKTLSILSEDTNIDINGYSWDDSDTKEDVRKITENGVYTAHIKDLAGNQGTCEAVVTTIYEEPNPAATMLMEKVGESGLEEVTHAADSTLQIGATEDITEYRFRGGNDVVTNNYVYFNCSDINNQSADTCELYRIIGVLPTDDGTGKIENRIKLIKTENYGNNYWNSNGTNNWAEPATLNTEFNTTYWGTINAKYQALVGDAKYYLGGYIMSDINTNIMYGYERQTEESEYYYSGNPTSWTGKLALMYASDYGYGANSACSESTNLRYYNTNSCPDNNWLYLGSAEWLLPQYSSSSYSAFYVDGSGVVRSDDYGGQVGSSYAVRPVLYLTSDAEFNNNGDGSLNNPYQLMGGGEVIPDEEQEQPQSNSVYSFNMDDVDLGATLDSISGYTTDYTTLGKDFFLKHNIATDNTVESQEVCYILNGTKYCLKGCSKYNVDEDICEVTNFEENSATLLESFGEENCSVNSDSVLCSVTGLNANALDDGNVDASDDSSNCHVDDIGGAYCYE